jgi:hypothetical protein
VGLSGFNPAGIIPVKDHPPDISVRIVLERIVKNLVPLHYGQEPDHNARHRPLFLTANNKKKID